LRRRRPTPGAQRLEGPISIGQKPSANGRPVRRMNSASRGLRPTVGLCRPKSEGPIPCVGGGRRLARKRLEGPISIGTKAFGQRSACAPNEFGLARGLRPTSRGLRSACADREGVLRRRRPTPGAERLEGPISIGQKPSADGRPVPTGKGFPASAEADAWRASALRGRFQSAQKPSANGRPARRMNSASRGLRPTVGLCRPKSVPCVGGGRRLARKRLEGPISIGTKAFGRRSACAPNEFGLERPSANGRPAPTGRGFCVGGGRRLARSALRGRFQSAKSLRPTVGLCRPKSGSLRRRRPTPGAQAP
jgi:hypothetical protein